MTRNMLSNSDVNALIYTEHATHNASTHRELTNIQGGPERIQQIRELISLILSIKRLWLFL